MLAGMSISTYQFDTFSEILLICIEHQSSRAVGIKFIFRCPIGLNNNKGVQICMRSMS